MNHDLATSSGRAGGRSSWPAPAPQRIGAIKPFRHSAQRTQHRGAIFAMGYQLLEHAELHVGDPVVVMMVAWALGQLVGMRRYG